MSEKKSKVGVWALAGKLGGKLVTILAKLVKGLKFTKLGLTAATLGAYSALYTWKFALLIMLAVGWHENGHVWAMKKMGFKTKGFYFLPFLGGVAIQEDEYKSYGQNVFVAMMGPIWGAALAFFSMVGYWITHNPMFAAAAAWMAFLNLFNLFPINPLDGGQIFRSITLSINKSLGLVFMAVSVLLAAFLLFKLKIGLFALILIVGLIELISEIVDRKKIRLYKEGKLDKWALPVRLFKDGEVKNPPADLNRKQLIASVLGFVLLVVFLVWINKSMAHVSGANMAATFLE